MKRYVLVDRSESGESEMQEHELGAWVQYEEHATLVALVQALPKVERPRIEVNQVGWYCVKDQYGVEHADFGDERHAQSYLRLLETRRGME